MDNLFNQPWWNVVSIAVTVILGVIAILISLKQNKKKRISYELNSLFPLFEIKSDVTKDIEIRYKTEIVTQLYIAEITIENFGDIPIKKEDYDEPILINFENCKHIFTVEILDVSPANLTVPIDLKRNDNILKIHPLLLNPTDFIKFKLVLEGENILINVKSRIADVKSIENKKNIELRTKKNYTIVYLILGVVWSLLAPFLNLGNYNLIGAFLVGWGIGGLILLNKKTYTN